jgi:hypothetical protein
MFDTSHQPDAETRLDPRRQKFGLPGPGGQVQRAWVRIWPATVFSWAEAVAA